MICTHVFIDVHMDKAGHWYDEMLTRCAFHATFRRFAMNLCCCPTLAGGSLSPRATCVNVHMTQRLRFDVNVRRHAAINHAPHRLSMYNPPPESAAIVGDGRGDRSWNHPGAAPASKFRPLEIHPVYLSPAVRTLFNDPIVVSSSFEALVSF